MDYLSPEYFKRYRLAMDEAKRLGMKGWLYDEGGWPSGGATGRVVQSNPEFGAQTVVAERRPWLRVKTRTPPGAVGVFVEGGKTVVVCQIRRNNFQPDRLNPAATRRFIELTHEGYERAMPQYLGSLMPWAFTDEPAVPSFIPGKQMPWTAALPEVFRAKKGYDLIASLPLLLTDPPITLRRQCERESISSTSGASFFRTRISALSAIGPAVTVSFRADISVEKTKPWVPRSWIWPHPAGHAWAGPAGSGYHLAATFSRPAQSPFSTLCGQRVPPARPAFNAHRIVLRLRQWIDAGGNEVVGQLSVCPRLQHAGNGKLSGWFVRKPHARRETTLRADEPAMAVPAAISGLHRPARIRTVARAGGCRRGACIFPCGISGHPLRLK